MSPRSRALRVVLGAVLVGGMGLSACKKADSATAGAAVEEAVAARVSAPSSRVLRSAVAYVGTVGFERPIKVRSQIPGVVDELIAAEGADVTAGATLTRIVAPEVKARLDQVEAEIRRAEVERAFVCGELEKDERLSQTGAIETIRAETTRKNCASATDAVSAAKARRAEARVVLGRTVEKAASDGRLLEWMVEAGEYVGPGQVLGVLGAGPRLVSVQVSEPDLLRGINTGSQAELRVGELVAKTTVVSVAPRALGPSRSTRVELALPEAMAGIPEGISVGVDFVLAEESTDTALPESAFARGVDNAVFVVESGVARRVEVTRGLSQKGWVAVKTGLKPDQKVVVSNVDGLVDGQRVYAVEVP